LRIDTFQRERERESGSEKVGIGRGQSRRGFSVASESSRWRSVLIKFQGLTVRERECVQIERFEWVGRVRGVRLQLQLHEERHSQSVFCSLSSVLLLLFRTRAMKTPTTDDDDDRLLACHRFANFFVFGSLVVTRLERASFFLVEHVEPIPTRSETTTSGSRHSIDSCILANGYEEDGRSKGKGLDRQV
jgi:hypothetical protein